MPPQFELTQHFKSPQELWILHLLLLLFPIPPLLFFYSSSSSLFTVWFCWMFNGKSGERSKEKNPFRHFYLDVSSFFYFSFPVHTLTLSLSAVLKSKSILLPLLFWQQDGLTALKKLLQNYNFFTLSRKEKSVVVGVIVIVFIPVLDFLVV